MIHTGNLWSFQGDKGHVRSRADEAGTFVPSSSGTAFKKALNFPNKNADLRVSTAVPALVI